MSNALIFLLGFSFVMAAIILMPQGGDGTWARATRLLGEYDWLIIPAILGALLGLILFAIGFPWWVIPLCGSAMAIIVPVAVLGIYMLLREVDGS